MCYNEPMPADQPDPRHRSRQFTIGALLIWMVLVAVSLTCTRYALETGGVLTVIALQSLGAALGAPFGYVFGDDRVAGTIIGALVGSAIGMLAALLVMTMVVINIVS